MGQCLPDIPVLTGESAERFLKMKEENEKKAGTIDFSKQFSDYKKMLEKSIKNGPTNKEGCESTGQEKEKSTGSEEKA